MVSTEFDRYGPFIDGEFETSGSGETFDVTDPRTGDTLAEVVQASEQDIDRAISASVRGFTEWSGLSAVERKRTLSRVGSALREEADRLAVVESAEMGRPLSQSRAHVESAADHFEYFAGLTDSIEGETIPVPGDRLNYTVREPLGVTAHLVPWNASLLLGSRGIAPALAAGNSVVVKPSSLAPLSLLEFVRLATDAGLPDGVITAVPGSGSTIGDTLVTDSRLGQVTFTGSTRIGKHIRRTTADSLVPTTLELGGKSPTIVFPDATLRDAARESTKAFSNAGQVCFATTRLFVHESVYDEFLEQFVEQTEALSLDDDVGPLISRDALSSVEEHVERAVENGARVRTGGKQPDRTGDGTNLYYQPTILEDAPDDAPVSCEEIFGPVVTVYEFGSAEEALRRANETEYGLSAAVWTDSVPRAHEMAGRLEAGSVAVNEYPSMFPQAPSGGYKESGLGRSRGQQALRSFTQLKNISVSLSNDE